MIVPRNFYNFGGFASGLYIMIDKVSMVHIDIEPPGIALSILDFHI